MTGLSKPLNSMARRRLIGNVMGRQWKTQHPVALNNPEFMDIDGNGFTANKDTLDIP